MTFRLTRAALLMGCAALAFPAHAETTAESDSADTADSATAATDNSPALDSIVVKGEVLYSDLVNALKSPTPVLDVPQSLSIVTEEEIERRGFTSIAQIADYTPGVTMSQGEGHRDAIIIHGIRS
ncbi:MAG: TonB-dependent receptor plug domain-containing protein, partial [Parvibaculum sp.]